MCISCYPMSTNKKHLSPHSCYELSKLGNPQLNCFHPQPFLTSKITQVAQTFENPQELTHLLFTSPHSCNESRSLANPNYLLWPAKKMWRLKSHQNFRNLKNPQKLIHILLPYMQPREHIHTHTHIWDLTHPMNLATICSSSTKFKNLPLSQILT